MNQWELAKYLIDAKKCIDSLLYISDHVSELRNTDLRKKADQIRGTFYINLCVVIDSSFSSREQIKEIRQNNLIIRRVYYERDKNFAHKDSDYKPRKYDSWASEIQDKKKEIEAVLASCKDFLPKNITLDYVHHDKELFRVVNALPAEKEEGVKKKKHPLYDQPIPAGVEAITKKVVYDIDDIRNIENPSEYCTVCEAGINQFEGLQNRQDFCIISNVLNNTDMWCSPNDTNYLKIQKLKENGFIDEFEVMHPERLKDPIIRARVEKILGEK